MCVWSSYSSSCTRSISLVQIDRSALKASLWLVPEASGEGEVGFGLELFAESSELPVTPTVVQWDHPWVILYGRVRYSIFNKIHVKSCEKAGNFPAKPPNIRDYENE